MKNGIDREFLSQKGKNGLILMGVILASFSLFYFLVGHFNYTWTWNKIPQYFVYKDHRPVSAESDGVVKITEGQKEIQLVDSGGKTVSYILSPSERKVSDGDRVFEGDILGEQESWKLGPLLTGLWVTLELSLYSTLLGLVLGLLCGLGRISRQPIISSFSLLYVEIIRGTPLLVQLLIIYFMFGSVVGIESRFLCGVLALGIFSGAYVGEILRAGIEAIHFGQMEAARSLGMSNWQAMTYVIMPQVFKNTLPALAGTFISLIKDSSLVSVMALTDLTKAGREIVSSSFMVFETYITVALLYFTLTCLFSYLFKKMEYKLSLGGKR